MPALSSALFSLSLLNAALIVCKMQYKTKHMVIHACPLRGGLLLGADRSDDERRAAQPANALLDNAPEKLFAIGPVRALGVRRNGLEKGALLDLKSVHKYADDHEDPVGRRRLDAQLGRDDVRRKVVVDGVHVRQVNAKRRRKCRRCLLD